jgi:hypothetical protein
MVIHAMGMSTNEMIVIVQSVGVAAQCMYMTRHLCMNMILNGMFVCMIVRMIMRHRMEVSIQCVRMGNRVGVCY